MITMKHGVADGTYRLFFKVYDRKHTQTDVPLYIDIISTFQFAKITQVVFLEICKTIYHK